jgi:tetratricopeptide (TPR) repeat protein
MRKASQISGNTRKTAGKPLFKSIARKSKAIRRAQASLKGMRGAIPLRRNGKLKQTASSPTSSTQITRLRRIARGNAIKAALKGRIRVQAKIAKAPLPNPLKAASIKQYENAVKLLYAQQYEKAKAVFEKLIQTFTDDKDIVERAKSHLRLCEQKIARKPPVPRTVEDHYNLAITLMNSGKYEGAIENLNKALRYNPNCDYVFYALAATNCRTGNFDGALSNLKLAINLKPENRFLAQSDSDFELLMQDSRFISMVYPDRTTPPQQ